MKGTPLNFSCGDPKKLDFCSSEKSLEFFYAANMYCRYSIGLRYPSEALILFSL
jgi:hypothetical protein